MAINKKKERHGLRYTDRSIKSKAKSDGRTRQTDARQVFKSDRLTRGARKTVAIAAARQAIFGTAELVENIILHLPLSWIFIVQRVCKQWKETIEKSKDIQRKALLAPGPALPYTWKPVIGEQKGVLLEEVVIEDGAVSSLPISHQSTPARLHPYLTPHEAPAPRATSIDQKQIKFYLLKEDGFIGKLFRGSSSETWRNLQLSDPPCFLANIYAEWYWMVNAGALCTELRCSRSVECSNGVTLGALLDALFDEEGDVSIVGYTWPTRVKRNAMLRTEIERCATSFEALYYQIPDLHVTFGDRGDL